MKKNRTAFYIILFYFTANLIGCQTVKGPSKELQSELSQYLDTKDNNFRNLYESLYIEGERNAVLNFNRVGWLNLIYGDFDEAEWAFDQSLNRIELIYAGNKQAEEAKSKFSEESVKDFKGEPYERAMAYYYRGILYLIRGDYENARATFRSGEFQDTLSDKEEFQSDFALLNFLQGWASLCNGDKGLADDAFKYANKYNSNLNYPDNEHRLLMLFDSGNGPLKTSIGEYKELLQFNEGSNDKSYDPVFFLQFSQQNRLTSNLSYGLENPNQATDVQNKYEIEQTADNSVVFQKDIVYSNNETTLEDDNIKITIVDLHGNIIREELGFDDRPLPDIKEPLVYPVKEKIAENQEQIIQKGFGPQTITKVFVETIYGLSAVDVYMQATTRGGRPIQGILDGKAQFKSTTETIAKVSSAVGAATTVSGLIVGNNVATAVGLGLQAGGLVASIIAHSTTPQADIRYWDTLPNKVYLATSPKPDDQYLLKVGDKISDQIDSEVYGNIVGGDERCAVYWATSKNPSFLPGSAPNARLTWQQMADKDDDVLEDDEFFRKDLMRHGVGIY